MIYILIGAQYWANFVGYSSHPVCADLIPVTYVDEFNHLTICMQL